MIRRKEDVTEMVIDLMGQEGNAYWLLGYVDRIGKALCWEKHQIKDVQEQMTSGDYYHLVAVFEKYFGNYVTLEADDDLMEKVGLELEKLE